MKKAVYSLHPVYFGKCTLKEIQEVFTLAGKSYTSVFVLIDKGVPVGYVHEFLGDSFPQNRKYWIQGGETAKTWESQGEIWNFLLHGNADRHSLLINIGGGAVCDAGGFAASVYKRGIDFIHVPTTLLAMADASVGGKTGINWAGMKNMIGTFSQPAGVFIQAHFLGSLNTRQLLSGYAEIIKHGLISDADHCEKALFSLSQKRIPDERLIEQTVMIKAAITERDPLEKGERKLLNFGHTLGHGIESLLANRAANAVLHGEAIAAGMLGEAYLSLEYGFSEAELNKMIQSLKSLTQYVYFTADDIPDMLSKIQHDKKNEETEIGIVFLKESGKAIWHEKTNLKKVEEALQFIVKTLSNK